MFSSPVAGVIPRVGHLRLEAGAFSVGALHFRRGKLIPGRMVVSLKKVKIPYLTNSRIAGKPPVVLCLKAWASKKLMCFSVSKHVFLSKWP